MENTRLTPEQVRALLANPNVAHCTAQSITYRAAFKAQAIKEYYEQGLGPQTIFLKAGFDLRVLGRDKPKNCLKRWRKTYQTLGEHALLIERRGAHGGRKKQITEPNDPAYLKAKIAYLEAENDFLRKLKTKPKV